MISRRRFISISAAAVGSGLLGSSSAKQPETVWRGHAFGADAHIVLKGTNGASAMQAALDTIQRLEHYFSIYDPGSLISELNRTGQLTMPPEFARLMNEVEFVHQTTDGLFDPTVQPIFAAKLNLKEPTDPKDHTVGWQHVTRSRNHIKFDKPGMAITLNGIAQGFATDRVSEVLAAHGFAETQINIGEYRVGENPTVLETQDIQGTILGTQTLVNAAMATSSRDGFTFNDGSGHILSPEGSPNTKWNTVSAITDTATVADGCSTALMLSSDTSLAKQLVSNGIIRSVILQDLEGRVTKI